MGIFKKFTEKNRREKTIIIIVSFIVLGLFVLTGYLFKEYYFAIEEMIEKHAIWGMIIYIIILILSIVVAPISAMPLIPIGSRLWGVAMTTTLSVIGWTIGAMIAFYLAKKLGRPYVAKILPLKKIEKIERMIPEQNIFWTIFFFRAITPFAGLSYVFGLVTRVKTKTFFWGTFLGLIPFCFVVAFLGSLPIAFLITGLTLATLILAAGIYWPKKMRERKNNLID
jgi:uncharacterized membrane protein YdjX (TVP38/TMEM64 family)